MPLEVALAAGLLERHEEAVHELFVSGLELVRHKVQLGSTLSQTMTPTHGSLLHRLLGGTSKAVMNLRWMRPVSAAMMRDHQTMGARKECCGICGV